MCINRGVMIEEGHQKFSEELYLSLEKQDQEACGRIDTSSILRVCY